MKERSDKKARSKLLRFVQYYKPHLPVFTLDMTCALVVSAVDIAYPVISRHVLSTLLPQGQYRAFFLVIGIISAAYLLRTGMVYIVTYLGHQLGVRMEAHMRRDVFTHLQTLSFRFFDKSRTGYLISRCTSDLFEIAEMAHHGPEDLFLSIVTLAGAAIVMLSIEWRLGLFILVTVPLMILFMVRQRGRMSRASTAVKESIAVINAGIESSISGVRVAKAFANEDYEIEKFSGGNDRFVRSKRSFYQAMGIFQSGMDFFMGMLNVLALGVGGFLILRGSMDVVTLITFTLYIGTFTTPIRRLAVFSETFAQGMAGFTRFLELLDTPPDITDKPGAAELSEVRGEIAFENVSFSYDAGVRVLKDVNLHVPAGKTLALVGPSGGGKTTLCHLIPRFYEPDSGRILLDGKDISTLTLRSLRAHVGIVSQDVFLFADTIGENIRYGRLTATREEIVAAARAAEIHDDIMAMPDGYDTVVGERGATLSGGQKQRISIARLFLKDPPVLLLDEATSALDSATEARISAAFDRLSRGRTTLVIAHRLSTIKNADEIIVIDEEGIRERGTHEQLMALGGEYFKLYTAQFPKD